MAVRGSGPSRRSHTKSRKGCKTCKRRHIRCDESYPQCRNCTKHHVRCDYLDGTTPEHESFHPASGQASPNANSDDNLSINYPMSDASYASDYSYILPLESEHDLGPDSQLIRNLIAIADNLDNKAASDMTVWVPFIRRHLSLASSHPHMMDALKALSATQLAWVSQSPAAREQSIQYSTAALSGLHQAVGQFNKSNADSVLATALTLVSQSRDWLSWSSLVGGIASITTSIESWEQETIYPDLIRRINNIAAFKATEGGQEHDVLERDAVLGHILNALQQLTNCLHGRPVEAHWVAQIVDLIQRLQNIEPAKTAEEQFNQLYVLRKWVLWLPVHLLQEGPVDELKLVVIAHLYATTLTLCPIFAIGTDLVGGSASPPLQSVLNRLDCMHLHSHIQALLQFPEAALEDFYKRNPWSFPSSQPAMPIPDISTYLSDGGMQPGDLSPAFTPGAFHPVHTRASSTASAFLEVPTPRPYEHFGLSQNTSKWGTFPSPNFPASDGFADDDIFFKADNDFKDTSDPFTGYTLPCEIWT